MPSIPKKDIPKFVRRCYAEYRTATADLRKAEEERLRCYAGGEGQWREEEVAKRKAQNRPIMTVNRLKPGVDQIEGDIRMNPPGPKVLPVGDGADGDTASIHSGLIREVEHRSNAMVAYSTAGRYQGASGRGVLELGTEYVSPRSFDQQLIIKSAEDPDMYFWDPNARMANRQDAMWGGKIRMYSREEYVSRFGKGRAILKERSIQAAMGWLQDFAGIEGNRAQVNEWTGSGKGPFFVVEFYMVETEPIKLRQYSDHVNRFDDEVVPKGVTELPDGDIRTEERRKICKYLVDAFEVLDDTEWLGTLIPIIPVLGQEIWINGKLYRLSLISEAIDPQRGLNYTATTTFELIGLTPKAPYIGAKGQFDDPRWASANTEAWAYLEYEPIFAVDPTNGQTSLAPPPQRNLWESPIQWLLASAASCSDWIKATMGIFDPSLGNVKGDQSGTAIAQLRSESNVGTFSYADNLHRAIQVLYEQIIIINCQILSGPRVVTIVRPDSEHELVTINQEFEGEVDPASGKQAKAKWLEKGRFAVAVTVGPNFETIKQQTSALLTEFLKIDPQIMAVPGVAAKALRSISQGDPEIEGIADMLEPNQQNNPQQVAQQLQQSQQQIKVLMGVIQKMHFEAQAKLPQIEADKWKALLDSLTKVSVAEVSASKDADHQQADIVASHAEKVLDMAHDTAMQATEHEHAKSVADQQTMNTMATQQQAADLAPEPKETAA